MYASRNIAKCTKDCLCLFVCPTGATDTESGQIDRNLCIDGCRLCVDACPSKAIYLVMEKYPEPLPKDPELSEKMLELCSRKYDEEKAVEAISSSSGPEGSNGAGKLAEALKASFRIVGEDCAREAGYMLPQCKAAKALLNELEK